LAGQRLPGNQKNRGAREQMHVLSAIDASAIDAYAADVAATSSPRTPTQYLTPVRRLFRRLAAVGAVGHDL
jgi:hypothetical protein